MYVVVVVVHFNVLNCLCACACDEVQLNLFYCFDSVSFFFFVPTTTQHAQAPKTKIWTIPTAKTKKWNRNTKS